MTDSPKCIPLAAANRKFERQDRPSEFDGSSCWDELLAYLIKDFEPGHSYKVACNLITMSDAIEFDKPNFHF